MMRIISALLVSLSLFAAPALADEDYNIAGSWSFSARIDGGCSFGGSAFLEKRPSGKFQCELTARQSCETLEEDFIVRQSCDVTVLGNQVSIRSQIVEFVNGFESPFYFPDNFTLTIKSDSEMFGALVSSGSARPSEWRRSEEGIS